MLIFLNTTHNTSSKILNISCNLGILQAEVNDQTDEQ